MSRPGPALLVLALLVAAPAARAQVPWELPPSAVLTNYDRVLIGQEEALESGAFVARVADSTAGWYNPAGLALVRRSVIGASATGYELDIVDLGQIRTGSGKVTLAQLPSYFGAVLGGDVISSDAWRIGLSITKPTSWGAAVNGATVASAPADSPMSYSSRVSISTLLPALSAAWAPLPTLRVGAGFGVAITSISQAQTLSVVGATVAGPTSSLRAVDGTGATWGGMGTLGLQWDVTERLVFGASMRTPTFSIIRTGSLTYQEISTQASATGPSTQETYFSDANASFRFNMPWTVNAGLAWREPRFDVEVDVRFHSAIPQYFLLSSSQSIVTVERPAGGGTSTTTRPFPGLTYGATSVWNVALGGRYQLDSSWSLHGGFYTDFAPTDPGMTDIFRSVSLYGLTAGAKLKGDHLSGSLGVGLAWGSSDDFTLGTAGGGAPVSTRLSIFSVSLLYALAYRF